MIVVVHCSGAERRAAAEHAAPILVTLMFLLINNAGHVSNVMVLLARILGFPVDDHFSAVKSQLNRFSFQLL